MQVRTKATILFAQALSYSGWIGVVLLVGLLCSAGCSGNSCSEIVSSEDEAKQALQKFFTSDTSAARDLIATLRKDGMTDEWLNSLQGGCRECYFFRGDTRNDDYFNDKRYWYVMTEIVPPEKKKTVELEIRCASDTRLNLRLYGG